MLSLTANVEGLLDAVPDALVGADSAGMIRFVNRQTELLFGIQAQAQEEIAEQRAKEQMHMAELERFQQMTIERALKVIELKKEIESLKGSGTTERGEDNDQW
jgi:PAS domain-containing protein